MRGLFTSKLFAHVSVPLENACSRALVSGLCLSAHTTIALRLLLLH